MATFGELKANVSNELGLDQTAAGTEDVLLGRRLNEAVREYLIRTRAYVVTDTVALVENDNEYDLVTELDPDPLALVAIVATTEGRPLEKLSVASILELRRGVSPVGAGVYRYAVNGASTLMVYPSPGASPGTLTVHYVPKPTEMSAAGHDPSTATYGNVPVEHHYLLEFYALWRMAGYDDDSSSQMGEVYRQRFEEGVIRARSQIRGRGGRGLAPARPGRGWWRRVPSHPSQDVKW